MTQFQFINEFDLLSDNQRVKFLKDSIRKLDCVKLIAAGNDPLVNAKILSGAVNNYLNSVLRVPCRVGHIEERFVRSNNTQIRFFEVPLFDMKDIDVCRIVKFLQYPERPFQVSRKDWVLTYCPRIVLKFQRQVQLDVTFLDQVSKLLLGNGIVSDHRTMTVCWDRCIVVDVILVIENQTQMRWASALDYFSSVFSRAKQSYPHLFFFEDENCYDYLFRLSETIRLKAELEHEKLGHQKELLEKEKLIRKLNDSIVDLGKKQNFDMQTLSSKWQEKVDSILSRSRAERKSYLRQISELEDRLSLEKQSSRRMEDMFSKTKSSFQKQITQQKKALSNVREERDDLVMEKDRMRRSKEELDKDLETKFELIMALKRELRENSSEHETEAERYRLSLKKLKGENHSLDEKVEEKDGELKKMKLELQQLKDSVKEVEGALENVRKERETLAKKLGVSEGQLKQQIEVRKQTEVDKRKLILENRDLEDRLNWSLFVNNNRIAKERIKLEPGVLHSSELSNVKPALLDDTIPVVVKTIKPDCGRQCLKTVLLEVFNNAAMHDGGNLVAKLHGFYEFTEDHVTYVRLIYERYDLDLKEFCTDVFSPLYRGTVLVSTPRRSPLDEKKNKMEVYYRVRILRKMADCVAQVHSKKAQHLDVKPKNFLVQMSSDNHDFRVLITDFGFLAIEDPEKSVVITMQEKCTFEYRGPEFFVQGGNFKSHKKTDVWSLGMAFYVVFENDGHRPIHWCTKEYNPEVGHRSRDTYRKPPFKDPRIQKIAHWMMEFDRKDRPTMDQVVDYLVKYEKELEQEISEDEKIDFSPSFEKFKKRKELEASRRKTVGLKSPGELKKERGSSSDSDLACLEEEEDVDPGSSNISLGFGKKKFVFGEDYLDVYLDGREGGGSSPVANISSIESASPTTPIDGYIMDSPSGGPVSSVGNEDWKKKFGFRNLDDEEEGDSDTEEEIS